MTQEGQNETLLATRNALTLGGSLLLTWGIAIAMRLLLPRFLGPDRFGSLSFADAFTTTFFLATSLGVDVYVRKHVSLRPEHASDFFGGTFALRTVMSAAILAAIAVVMHVTHRPPEVRLLVYVFALAQFFITTNATLSALLHAKGRVGGMSVLSIVTKVTWAGGVLLAIVTGVGLWGFAAALLVSEAIETVALFVLAGRHLGLVFRVDARATRAMVLFSLPYYLNTFASTAYGKLDVSLLALVATSTEVGWYAAASAIAGLALLGTPLIGWVLMPTFARAAARSPDELFARIRSSTEFILAIAIPGSLFICLGADLGIRLVFGAAFAPAALALRILAPTFVITYVAMIYAITLLMLERAWTLTKISILGLGVNLILNVALVRPSMALFGEGGGGAGCALAMLGTELFVTLCMAAVVGRKSFDNRTLGMVGKSLAACAVVLVVDRLTTSLGWARLGLDAVVYLGLVISTGALQTAEIVRVVKEALRKQPKLAEPTGVALREQG